MNILRDILIIISGFFSKKNKNYWYEKGRELRIKRLQKKKTWLEIKKGDSQAKVASMLGKPNSVEKREKDLEQQILIYDCGSEGKRIINFKDEFIEKIEVKF